MDRVSAFRMEALNVLTGCGMMELSSGVSAQPNLLNNHEDGIVRLWNTSNEMPLQALKGYEKGTSLAFSPDDDTVRLWEVSGG